MGEAIAARLVDRGSSEQEALLAPNVALVDERFAALAGLTG